ncbi:GGDEF domain-containing protein [Pseudomonas sp. FP1762]|uniref:GGDEF domain-containing protein n=1 Tax=Pseudomonas sp. FP1762 TaxID=2954080 RepID=UPI0027335B18|nr:GGDEF domain-containing protein [Pseudomonas sp. FP1762]WLG64186.1 GGDEF domain-containing protein [Pseudomonas sp. FP1762]
MPEIDLTIITICSLTISALAAGYMLLLTKLGIRHPALLHWIGSCVIFVFASLLAASRLYQVTPLISVWLAHCLLALPPVLIATGLLRFFHGTERSLPTHLVGTAMAAYSTLLFFTYELSHSAPILTAVFIALACFWCIALLASNSTQRLTCGLLQSILTMHALTMCAEVFLYTYQWQTMPQGHEKVYLKLALVSHLLLTTIASMLLPLLLFMDRERYLMLQADRDDLTQLPNRRHFLRESAAGIDNNDGMLPTTIMMLDLDNFKSINDTFGHAIGDAALKKVASILKIELSQADFIGRLGGEEFAIVMIGLDEAGARTTAERLRQKIELHARIIEGKQLNLTISIGATFSYARDSSVFQALMKTADDALFEAKRRGRNRVIFDSSKANVRIG